MCSCSSKWRASSVAIKEEAEGQELAGAEVAETEVAEADMTLKCNSIRTCPLH